jgi:hypothetical protein
LTNLVGGDPYTSALNAQDDRVSDLRRDIREAALIEPVAD